MAAAAMTAACDNTDNTWAEIPDYSELEPGSGNTTGGEDNSGESYSSSDAAYEVRNFTIEWDKIDETTYSEDAENTGNMDVDDLVENSSFTKSIIIRYEGSSATVEGEVAGISVSNDNAHVSITAEGASGVEYILSGESADGQFKLYSDKKAKITLNGLSLSNNSGSAINIQSKKRMFMVITDGTTNNLTDASSYKTVDGEDEKATIFAEGQLIVSGNGTLKIKGNYKHGICSDQYVVMRTGTYIKVSSVKDGIHTNDGYVHNGGILVIESDEGDGIDSESDVYIHGGLIKIKTDGTASKGIKSDADITITGGQQIVITTGEAEYDSDEQDISSASCIKCDSTLTIAGGEMYMKSIGTGGKGINVDGELIMNGGTIYALTTGARYTYGSSQSGNNGMGGWGRPGQTSTENSSSPKGIKVTGNISITGGTIRVRATGATEGSEGMESKSNIYINGGDIAVYAADDALNAKSHIEISGGHLYAYATSNDGIDSNGTITITGGVIVTSGATAPEEGFDCDQNTFSVTGGTLIGIGGSTSTPTSSKCTQNVLIYGGSQASANTQYTLTDTDGNHIFSYTTPRTYNSFTMLVSMPELKKGTYILYSGGTVSGGNEYNGLVTNATYTTGTQLSTMTISSSVTTAGTTNGGMGGGRW